MERLDGASIAASVDQSLMLGEFHPVKSKVEQNLLQGFIDSRGAGFPYTAEGFIDFVQQVKADISSCDDAGDEIAQAAKEVTVESLNRRAQILRETSFVEFIRNRDCKDLAQQVSKWAKLYEGITKHAAVIVNSSHSV